jgi:hypothetical protein
MLIKSVKDVDASVICFKCLTIKRLLDPCANNHISVTGEVFRTGAPEQDAGNANGERKTHLFVGFFV